MEEKNRRDYIRYDPDKNSLIRIFLDGDPHDPLIGLLLDKSEGGCGAIFHETTFDFEKNDHVKIKPGKISPRMARIAWIVMVDNKTIRAGFEYLDE